MIRILVMHCISLAVRGVNAFMGYTQQAHERHIRVKVSKCLMAKSFGIAYERGDEGSFFRGTRDSRRTNNAMKVHVTSVSDESSSMIIQGA